METIIITSLIVTSVMSFILGKYHERINWNKLIEKGVFPKPNKK
jgi:hypothetical protein